jgi:hypothetical protein
MPVSHLLLQRIHLLFIRIIDLFARIVSLFYKPKLTVMRKITGLFIMVILSASSYAQQTNTQHITKEHFLEKSKNQKKAAYIMLAAGVVLFGTAILIPRGEYEGTGIDPVGGVTEKYSNDGVKGVCVLTGTLSMLGSIPLFLASSRNKKKAMSISLKKETAPQFYNNRWVYVPVPSITVRLAL